MSPNEIPAPPPPRRESPLARLARAAADWSGTSAAFGIALLTIAVWGLTGPLFGYSDTWQLVINTGTTVGDVPDGVPHPAGAE